MMFNSCPIRPKKHESFPAHPLACLSRKRHYPIRFPILSSIVRERLFETAGVWLDGGKAVATEDHSSFEFFLVIELALTLGELANHRLFYNSVCAVCPVQTPLVRFRVVKP
jgi:hypothetical protein